MIFLQKLINSYHFLTQNLSVISHWPQDKIPNAKPGLEDHTWSDICQISNIYQFLWHATLFLYSYVLCGTLFTNLHTLTLTYSCLQSPIKYGFLNETFSKFIPHSLYNNTQHNHCENFLVWISDYCLFSVLHHDLPVGRDSINFSRVNEHRIAYSRWSIKFGASMNK